jgi:hypothetical protein
LNTYSITLSNGCYLKYGDYAGRTAVDISAYSYYTNFVGNVLGKLGQVLLGYNSNNCFDDQEHAFDFENLSNFLPNNQVVMWYMGDDQSHVNVDGTWAWVPTTYQTQLRQGNWDWVSQSQVWYSNPVGATGLTSTGTAQTIPNSLYLASKPAFFGAATWPWVDPSTGLPLTLPAKARFDAGTPNTVQ